MYAHSACPTQLFLGQFLSGLHLLTMDYLKDGSYIFRMFKNSISECQIPSIIYFLLFKGINNASWCCSKASKDRGGAPVLQWLPGGPLLAECWCGFWGFCNPRAWLGSSGHFCPETGPLLWMEMSPHNPASSFEGCPPLDLQEDKTQQSTDWLVIPSLGWECSSKEVIENVLLLSSCSSPQPRCVWRSPS